MSYVAKDKEVDAPAPVKLHKIRITLTSRNVKSLEKMSNDLVNRSKDKKLHVKGPVCPSSYEGPLPHHPQVALW